MRKNELKFIETLALLERISVQGKDKLTIGEVGRWAGLKPATAQRIAAKLIRINVVTYQEFKWRAGVMAKDLRLSPEGKALRMNDMFAERLAEKP